MTRSVVLTALTMLALVSPVVGQQDLNPVRTYALTNARIVVSPGNEIASGTVLIRDGRIEAVGAQVNVPPGVTMVDLSGKIVYPGLIDAASTIGLPAPAPNGRGGFPGGNPSAAEAEQIEDPSPSREAAQAFDPSDDDLNALRAAGITTAAVGFRDGIFTGQVAAVSTRNASPQTLVLRRPVSVQVTFGRNRGRYPSTQMGAISYIRQAFYNAQWEILATEAFAQNPATAPRPTFDPEATALIPVVEGNLSLWMNAGQERVIGRMVDIANEFEIDDFVLVGVQEGYRIADQLADLGKPVIVSVDFLNPNVVTGRAFELNVAPISGENTADAQADSVAARALRGNAAALVNAGVSIALSSWGLNDPATFRTRVLDAVEAGLSEDDALRAMTVTPAEILGLGGSLGTVEPRKLANLVVTDGDLFSRDSRIEEVFVEGERYIVPEEQPEDDSGGRGGGSSDSNDDGDMDRGGIR